MVQRYLLRLLAYLVLELHQVVGLGLRLLQLVQMLLLNRMFIHKVSWLRALEVGVIICYFRMTSWPGLTEIFDMIVCKDVLSYGLLFVL
jgi:hypothetical protein